MTNETQPFDQLATVFRDAVVDKVKQSDGYGENAPFNTDDTQEWSEGFINTADCAQIVFRDFLERGIIAARQPAPVVREGYTPMGGAELIKIFQRGKEQAAQDGEAIAEFSGMCAIVHEVEKRCLAAQAVQVPDDLRLPDGWLVGDIGRVEFEDHAYYHAQIYGPGDLDEAEGEGPEPWDALRDAIVQAKGGAE